MTSYSPPVKDLRFVLDVVAGIDEIFAHDAFADVDAETVEGVLEEAARFMAEVVAPLNVVGDQQGSRRNDDGTVTTPDGYGKAYQRYVDAGWGGVPFDPAYGGGGFPWTIGLAIQEMLTSASMAFSLCPLLTQGAIDALVHHGSEEQREVYLPKMVTGEWSGTMNLTEPDAGSDVGALATTAVRLDDGSYLITGTKIFITFGEHDLTDNIVHLVLARTPDAPPGTKGISCFIVPKYLVGDDGSLGERNDVTCVSIEHKLGIHGSPTCVLSFGDAGGAVGHLIGEENQGMRYMFTMMNNARLSVGLEGLALSERAYQQALDYAQERQQGRAPGAPKGESSPIIDHPDVRRMLLTMRSYIDAMRALVLLNSACLDHATTHPDADERDRWAKMAELLTPLSKAWCTDLGVELTSIAVQVHGGMGYVEETGVAQHFRDARIAPIYEGTNGIQAIDLVVRKLPMDAGAVVIDLLDEMASLDGELAAAGDELASLRVGLAEGVKALREATDWLIGDGLVNPLDALAGAAPYLRLFATVVGGWLQARMALAAAERLGMGDADSEFLEAKIVSARFYGEQLLPQATGLVGAVTGGSDVLFALSPAQLGP